MLIYEKKVGNVRKLFGSETGVPADNDIEVVFKKEDGTVVSDLTVATQLKDAGKGQMKKLDGTIVNAWVGDTSVIPVGLTPVNEVIAQAPKSKKEKKEVAEKVIEEITEEVTEEVSEE